MLGKKPIRESTRLFSNLTTDSDSVTQNSLKTFEIKHRIYFIRAEINFERKKRIGRTVRYYSWNSDLWCVFSLIYFLRVWSRKFVKVHLEMSGKWNYTHLSAFWGLKCVISLNLAWLMPIWCEYGKHTLIARVFGG